MGGGGLQTSPAIIHKKCNHSFIGLQILRYLVVALFENFPTCTQVLSYSYTRCTCDYVHACSYHNASTYEDSIISLLLLSSSLLFSPVEPFKL